MSSSRGEERFLNQDSPSDFPVRFIPGVGPKIAELLAKRGIQTAEDLLFFFPYKYIDRRKIDPIGSLAPGERTVIGKILKSGIVFFGRQRRRAFELLLADDSGAVLLKWFHFYPRQMMAQFQRGNVLMVSGPVTLYKGECQFVHPTVQSVDSDLVEEIKAPGIIPTYSEVPGLRQRPLRRILKNCLERFPIYDPLPPDTLKRHSLPSRPECFKQIHFPGEGDSLEELNEGRSLGHRRAVFEELFFLELGLALKRRNNQLEAGLSFSWSADDLHRYLSLLPFELTKAQQRVLGEILQDLKKPTPMNRLLQGDVGSGKTVVALLAALVVIRNGFQVALMAPTEILAEQHFQTARRILAPFKIPFSLLTGSLSSTEKTKLRSRLRRGIYPLVVGTHALISEGVEFKKLGLAVVDEQHRFGVLQRAALKGKGSPDVLIMTATPIPRTLALTIFGDLDLSILDEMPPGRQPIRTLLVESRNRGRLYSLIEESLGEGGQGYIVYPLIEESELLALKDATRMHQELKKVFPNRRVSLLHGRVRPDEKERVFREFRSGEVDLLVATSVIEVGVDVPNATLMVIEHADRFGLSQLHQLRGRVGRGSKPSTCILVSDYRKSEAAFRRLEVMCRTQDGFVIAEEDLKIRGPGDFLGTRQSGLPDLKVTNLLRDHAILHEARTEAFRFVESDSELARYPLLKGELLSRWKERLALAQVG